MSKTIGDGRHTVLIERLVAKRKSAGLTKAEVASKLKVYQSHIARLESGQRRVDVIELLDLGIAIGFDPAELLRAVATSE